MFLGVPIASILTVLAAASFGFFMHVLAKVSEIREHQDSGFTIAKYVARAPYKFTMKAMTVVGASVMLAAPELTPSVFVSAVGLGYAADSAGNHLKRMAPK